METMKAKQASWRAPGVVSWLMVYQLAGDFYKILRGGCTIFANLLILNLPTKKKNTNFSADKNAGSIDGISIRLPNYQLDESH